MVLYIREKKKGGEEERKGVREREREGKKKKKKRARCDPSLVTFFAISAPVAPSSFVGQFVFCSS